MGKYPANHGVPSVENDNAEHHRWETQCLRPEKQDASRLWEYDNIIKSLYLLDYIDSPPLRHNVQRALNRGESYHQLRRAVAYANFGKLRLKSEHEQQIWGEYSRLITNCVIFYNATLLARLLQQAEANGNTQAVALLKHISPVAWQHVNFYGRYEFENEKDAINLDAIINELIRTRFHPGRMPTVQP